MPPVDTAAIQAVLVESREERQYDPFVRHEIMSFSSR
jgi:hypothetical protein